MYIESQNFIPVHIPSALNQPSKPPQTVPSSGFHLANFTDKVTIASQNIDVTATKMTSENLGVSWYDPYNVVAPEGVGKIFDAFQFSGSVIGMASILVGKEQADFLTAAVQAGDHLDELIKIAHELTVPTPIDLSRDELNSHKLLEPRRNFLAVAAKAGDQIGTLVEITRQLGVKEREDFLTFSAKLSGQDLQNFLITIGNSPEDMALIMDTAANFTDGDLSNYLQAASMAGDKVKALTGEVNKFLDESTEQPGANLSAFLSASSKAGQLVNELVAAFQNGTEKTKNNIVAYINTQAQGQDLDNFISSIRGAGDGTITNIIDISSSLREDEKSNFLTALSGSNELRDKFIQHILSVNPSPSGASAKDFSDFLATASKAGSGLDTLLELSSKLDLSFASDLSAVDTINFLDAASVAGAQLDRLTALAGKLSGSDRSNLLYAAGHSSNDLGNFLGQVEGVEEEERSVLLSTAANKGQDSVDRAVYMKGLLSTKEYDNFAKAAKAADDEHLKTLMAATEELPKNQRAVFLEIAAGAEETLGEFTNTFKKLSPDERKDFLDLGEKLTGENLKNFVKAADMSDENFSELIDLTQKLTGTDRGHFLSAAGSADHKTLGKLIALVDKLAEKPQQSFLRAAADAGVNLQGLVGLAENIISRQRNGFLEAARKGGYEFGNLTDYRLVPNEKYPGHLKKEYFLAGTDPDLNFESIFNSAATTGKSLGKFIKAFV